MDKKDMPISDLIQMVLEDCSKETILDNAEGFLNEIEFKNFLLACLGNDIE